MANALVIVESPAKARTIKRFLGQGFRVEASVGHVRDLPRNASEVPASKRGQPWARLGVDVEGGFKPLYVVPAEKRKQVKLLREALAAADELYLATDEDREGESISWHLVEVLKPKVPVRRLVFHEITPEAIRGALDAPRGIDEKLVRAQETRRVLDRLFGYEVSPLLWRKVRPQLSAGRVQSVAVRLVVERERERMAFRSAEWWDVLARFGARGGRLEAELVEWGGRPVARGRDFDKRGRLKRSRAGAAVLDEAAARAVVAALGEAAAVVDKVEDKPFRDRPRPPFTTSTLQQEANRKLRWSARQTMKVAQSLYENGWITYMRTDSVALSDQAIAAARGLIRQQYGDDFLPARPRTYKNKSKNAQEAHEAIRPAGSSFRSLDDARRELDADGWRLYELIWKRTVASQMTDALGRTMEVRVRAGDAALVARGRTITFPGYRRAYVEGSDDPEASLADQEKLLPPVEVGEALEFHEAEPRRHVTKPPARLTEATLVKELERRGIGRPSTYASIIDTILRRNYVFKKNGALVPTFTAFAVVDLLERYLSWLVDYEFTARMEDALDEIAVGRGDPIAYLERFYAGENGLKDLLARAMDRVDAREVCTIPLGRLDDGTEVAVRVGRFGPYLDAGERRASLPEDLPPDELDLEKAAALLDQNGDGPRQLGVDPDSGRPVFLMNGRFGPYVQLGEAEGKAKPPRASLLKGMVAEEVDLDTALALLSLPRDLGPHPETGEPVLAANGRYGPYVKSGKTSRSLPDNLSPLTVTLAEAVEVLAQAPARRRRAEPLKELGEDPSTGRPVKLMSGRFGPYVTDGETNASLPRGTDPDTVDLAQAIELIRAREGKPKRKRATRRKATAAGKAPTKKATARKAATKKAGTRKTATKKATARKAATKKAGTRRTATKKGASE